MNLGLRYEIYTPVKERFNYIGNFDPNVNPATTPAIEQVGPGEPLASLYKTGLGYLEPRLGVAWDVRGNGKTVVRAGRKHVCRRRVPVDPVSNESLRGEFPEHWREQ